MSENESELFKRTDKFMLKNRIADINMEIQFFLHKFSNFRKQYDIADKALCENLQNVVIEIEAFFDNNPKHFDTGRSECKIDFDQHNLERPFICGVCEMSFADRSKHVMRHIKRNRHKDSIARMNQKDNKSKELNGESSKVNNENSKSARSQKQLKRDEERRNKHLQKQQRIFPKKAKLFLSSNIEQFLREGVINANKMRQIPAYKEIQTVVKSSVHENYPNTKVYFFGSRINGLGNVHSDLDIFIDTGDCFNLYEQSPTIILSKIKQFRDSLKSAEWKNFRAILEARIPILRVKNIKEKIDCDFSFSNGLASCNTLLMKYYLELQPVAQMMGLFIKKWLTTTTLDQNFSTYILLLMLIFYLQTQKLLPSVQTLQDGISQEVLIGPWLGVFKTMQLKELGIEKIPDDFDQFSYHILAFFEYYSKFDYERLIISPYLGKPIERVAFCSDKNLLQRYHQYLEKNKTNTFQITQPMCIQDPLEHNHNVAKGISLNILNVLIQFSAETKNELIKWKTKITRNAANSRDSSAPSVSKEPNDLMPKRSFNIDEFKRFYSNEDKAKSISYFWEKFDPENYSIWIGSYKYNKELTKVVMSCNLISGMFQRLDKMRKLAFASVCLFGEENNSSISGIWVWRGQDLVFKSSPDWQTDYDNYDWQKLDPKSGETRNLVKQYFAWSGADKIGRKFNQGKIFN